MPPSTTSLNATAIPLPPSAPPVPLNPQVFDPVVTTCGLKFGQMMERLRLLDEELLEIEAQSAGQAMILDGLQRDRDSKVRLKEHIKGLLRSHYHKMALEKEFMTAQTGAAGSAPQNGLAEAGPSSQSYPPHVPKPPMTEMMDQFLQSRGAPSAPQAPSSQNQSYPTIGPEAPAAQMQKLTETRRIRPPSFGSSQTGTNPQETGGISNTTNAHHIQAVNPPAWYGTLSAAFPNFGGQATNEIQMHVVGMFGQPIRADNWPKNLALESCKEPLKDNQELRSWLKHQSQTLKMQFRPNPRAPDGSMNEQKFQALCKSMTESRLYACTGFLIPSGKFIYMVIFPLQSYFVGVILPDSPPDLPGSGNMLDDPPPPPPPEVTEPLPLSELGLRQALVARIQALEPTKQMQFLAFIRAQQSLASSQAANSHRRPISYREIATMLLGFSTNDS